MTKTEFRPDLEGVRGIAVALVVLFHAGLLGVGGGFIGVDAFYVISGFLITGLLARELSATGGLDLAAFYGRRARRILPAATAAIVVILAAAAFVVAPLDLPSVAIDASASGLFVGNLLFAFRATDYFAAGGPSPFLHYWSLGVEEQFYLVWPLLLLVAFRLRHPRLFTSAVCLVSLALCVALTPTDTQWAFYGLPTRAWQLAAGSLLALNTTAVARLPSASAALAGWFGLGLLGVAAVALEPAGYPGFAAILPTVAVALLIIGGTERRGSSQLVTMRPLRFLGRISFSVYLYHWPVLVLGEMALGDVLPRPLLVALALAIGYASWRFVEEPFRRAPSVRPARRSLLLTASTICMVLVISQIVGFFGTSSLAASNVIELATPAPTAIATATASAAVRGVVDAPASTTPSAAPSVAPATPSVPHVLVPTIAAARSDVDGLNERGCGLSLAGSRPPLCELGDTDGVISVALVGDSHAAQWFPALELIAEQRGWKVLPFTKDSCIFVDTRIISLHLGREYTECALWRENVIAEIQRASPDLVVVSSSRWVHPVNAGDADAQVQGDAMARLVKRLPGRVVIIADTPLNDQDIPACLSRRDRTPATCSTSRSYALTGELERDGRAANALGAVLVDPAMWLCLPDVCPAVIDWTIVYRDDHHLTATMARRLAPLLEPGLLEALSSQRSVPANGGTGR